jgi:hypothetical protein
MEALPSCGALPLRWERTQSSAARENRTTFSGRGRPRAAAWSDRDRGPKILPYGQTVPKGYEVVSRHGFFRVDRLGGRALFSCERVSHPWY